MMWPWVSLILLKPSRSTRITVNDGPESRSAVAISFRAERSNPRRLRNPVSGSVCNIRASRVSKCSSNWLAKGTAKTAMAMARRWAAAIATSAANATRPAANNVVSAAIDSVNIGRQLE
jgi:hypothetical protein